MPSADPRPGIVPKNPRVVASDAPGGPDYRDAVLDWCREAGLDAAGIAPAVPLTRAEAQIRHRIDSGLVNGMKFTFLRPERSTRPDLLVEGARSVVVGARTYAHAEPVIDIDGPVARIARYAWVDHYADLKRSLTYVAAQLRRDGHRATVFADDNSVVDREVAHLAGLGWYGKNANVLVPGRGSMHVLGCLVTTADLPASTMVDDGCGVCSRCIPACPTGAITSPGVIDARRCLSWLLQKPGVFDRAYRAALGDRIYGCDDCQTACPVNRRESLAPAPAGAIAHLDVLALLASDDDTLDRATDRWWVHERNMVWVRRNLLVVLGNTADPRDPRVAPVLAVHLASNDAIVRGHAVWAAARLGLSSLLDGARGDSHPVVVAEFEDLPPCREDL